MKRIISILLTAAIATASANAGMPETKTQELQCLAATIHQEARGEPVAGMIAVGNVVLNRVKSSGFPSTVCEVVTQKVKKWCQFTWACEKQPEQVKVRDTRILNISYKLLNGLLPDNTGGSTHFHNADFGGWKGMKLVKRIGNHFFYR